MLKYENVIDGWTPRWSTTPAFANRGFSVLFGSITFGTSSVRHVEVVELAFRERQHARIAFFHDGNLDPSDQRQRLAAHPRVDLAVRGIVALDIRNAAKTRVGLDHDAAGRAASP